MTLNERQLAIVQAIRRYCGTHPHAGDTVEGIGRWWLGELGPCLNSDVEAALEKLVADGALGCRSLPDGTVIYFCPEGT